MRVQEVVGIEEDEKFSADVFHSGIACVGASAVGFVYDLESMVVFGILVGNVSAVVCAAIVHEDGFPVLVCLVENAVECPGEVFLYIIYWYDDGNHDA